jgi:hypothetical protein
VNSLWKAFHCLLWPPNETHIFISPQNVVLQIDDKYNSHIPIANNTVYSPYFVFHLLKRCKNAKIRHQILIQPSLSHFKGLSMMYLMRDSFKQVP